MVFVTVYMINTYDLIQPEGRDLILSITYAMILYSFSGSLIHPIRFLKNPEHTRGSSSVSTKSAQIMLKDNRKIYCPVATVNLSHVDPVSLRDG